jgi:cytochrome bd ubiquinol oxidase subunit II
VSLDLNVVWFLLVGTILTGYAVLDGFDLGVGILHLLCRGDVERRISLNSIGPVWDGNQVWLVVGGGALFAAFPEVYATAFSGFYDAFILLLFTLIFRGVAIKFRSKRSGAGWRRTWDVLFSLGSLGAALLLGVALGNLARGVPIDAQRNVTIRFLALLNPYALTVGVTAAVLLALHGAIYLLLKTEGEMHARVRGWVQPLMIAFILLYALTTLATLLYQPHLTARFRQHAALLAAPVAAVLAIANIPREIHHGRDWNAFLSSSASIVVLMGLVGIGLFPNLLLSNPNPHHSLTIYNAASSPATLKTMLIMVIVGLPMVLAYTTVIYWVFRGKVRLDHQSY